jgi:hypothetical protein
MVRDRGERWLNQLREGPIGRLIPKDAESVQEAEAGQQDERRSEPPSRDTVSKGIRSTLEQWQIAIDERVRAIMTSGPSLTEIHQELKALSERVAALEAKMAKDSTESDDK